ncbi:unnamed protein product [Nippostrongylus brasiliensis]|uniref:Ovule protein n=1 Tax=Nippostrongylus brasiliensis TaxID=27835 RepID=A0A0N4Y3P4_NIPBR|nr:unnamed protein product [Nippostrongylus brasiliensis]
MVTQINSNSTLPDPLRSRIFQHDFLHDEFHGDLPTKPQWTWDTSSEPNESNSHLLHVITSSSSSSTFITFFTDTSSFPPQGIIPANIGVGDPSRLSVCEQGSPPMSPSPHRPVAISLSPKHGFAPASS